MDWGTVIGDAVTGKGGTAGASVAARLTSYRERHGWTTAELARRLGVRRQALDAWESGAGEPPPVVRQGLEILLAREDADGFASSEWPPAFAPGEEHFRFTLNSAGIYAFTYDLRQNRVRRIGALKFRFGLAAEGSAEEFVARVHPGDRAQLLSKRSYLPTTAAETTPPYRLQTVDGEWRWLQDIVTATTAGDGDAARLFGITLDVTERIRGEDAVRQSEQRLSLALDAGQLSIWDWDITTGRVACNDLHFRLAGYEPGEVEPTYDNFVRRIHPADWPEVEAELERSRSSRTTFGCTFRFLHPDASEVHVEARGRYYYGDDDEAVRLVGTLRDVSEQRADEARQELLIREVDHRAKNMLAVVSAMISLSATDKSDVTRFVETVQHRLRAMSRVHDLIASSRWEGADLRETVGGAGLASYTTSDRPAALIEGEDVSLCPEAALALSMIVHELITNAARHGALSVESGRVDLSWERTASEDLDVFWVESGGPPVRRPVELGFGSQLINNGVAGSAGETELAFDPAGVRCRIRIPSTQIIRPTVGAGSPAGVKAPVARGGSADPSGASPLGPAAEDRGPLRVLVVEDDFLIALNTRSMLDSLGCEVVGPVASIDDAMDLADRSAIDLATLDVQVGDQEVFPLAERLDSRSIPFAFATGYGRRTLGLPGMENRPLLAKPYDTARLREAIEGLIGRRLSDSR